MTSFPSLSNLVSWLFYLCWYSIGYNIGTNPWSKVTEMQANLSGWFGQLKQWALDNIAAAKTSVTNWAQAWFNFLEAWRVYLDARIGDAWSWIDNTAKAVVTWVNLYKAKLADFADRVYAWLIWLWGNPYNMLRYYIGSALDWLQGFFANQYATIVALLGGAWSWLLWFVNAPYNALRYYVGGALDWLQWFWGNPLGAIEYYLGAAWTWLKNVFANQYAWLASVLGAPWGWLLSLWGLNPNALIAFIRDCLKFWYDIWSWWRAPLFVFLSNPSAFILAAIRAAFLDWLTQLIADNW